MLISSWNVNSVRARLENILDYLEKEKPDILMLQEIKAQEINFPKELGGREGVEPVRFGDWEKKGIAIDF